MPVIRRVAVSLGLVLIASYLSGCGSISSFMAGGMADLIPAWAGGLPADAPPRPGTPAYDAYMKQRENQQGDAQGQASRGLDPATSASASAIH
jgi:hypothetical protein